MINKAVYFLLLALSLATTTCTSATGPTIQPDDKHLPTATSTSNKTIFFPRQEKIEGERAVMDGEIFGTLVLADSCIRVMDRDNSDNSYLLIWPPDFNISIDTSSINILDGIGEIVAHIGDKVHISGGGVPLLSMLDKSVQDQVPPQCTSPYYWIIGDEITIINPSK